MLARRQLLLGAVSPLMQLKRLLGEGASLWVPATIQYQFQVSDGTSPVAASGDPLGRVTDIISGNHLTQSTAGARVTWVVENGIAYAHRESGQSLGVSSSQALFKYLYDGTGMTVLKAARYVTDSTATIGNTASGAGVGWITGYINGTHRLRFVVGNGSATLFNMATANMVLNVNEWLIYANTFSTADGARFYMSGTQVDAVAPGSITNTPSTADSSNNFTWPITAGTIDFSIWATARRVMTAAEIALATQLIRRVTGLP